MVKQSRKMAHYAQENIFGDENGALAPVDEDSRSSSENSITSDDDAERRKGTAPSREQLTIQQKLKTN